MKQAIEVFTISLFLCFSTTTFGQNPVKQCYSLDCLTKNYKTVESLTLEGKNIEVFPTEIFLAKNLKQLELVNTSIENLPDTMGVLKDLESVRLEKNEMLKQNEIFSKLSKIPSLKSLDLSNNGWFYISNEIRLMTNLNSLNLSKNYLENIPRELFTDIQLNKLFLSSNKIKNLPPEIQLTATLNTLDISYNKKLNLREAIEYFEMIPSLQNLTLGYVDNLPKSLKNAQQLKHLSVREGNCNKVLEVSSKITGLESLEIIYPKKDLKTKETEKLTELTNLKSLTITSLNSVDLSSENFVLPNLTKLKVQANELLIGKLDTNRTPNLKNLSVSNSVFSKKQNELLDESLINLKNIELISTEGIESINLSHFDSIESIDLAYSGLDLTANDFNLTCPIKYLNIAGNNIPNSDLEILQSSFSTARLISPNTLKNTGRNVVTSVEVIEVKDMKNETDFTYQANKEKLVITKDGYEINIPKNAFVDKNGNSIDEKVEVKVTTYSSPLEIALAGIPMTYNENEEPRFFSSSSMFKIETNSENRDIRINPNTPLQVNMPVNRSTDTLYQLNESTGIWEKQSPTSLVNVTSNKLKIFNDNLVSISKVEMPKRPNLPQDRSHFERLTVETKKEKEKASFSFVLHPKYNHPSWSTNFKKFSNVRQMKKFTWHYDGENAIKDKATLDSLNKHFKKYYTRKTDKKIKLVNKHTKPALIRNVELIPNFEKDNFTLKLLVGNQIMEIPCYPETNVTNHDLEAKKISRFYNGYKRANKRKTKTWAKINSRYKSSMVAYDENYAIYESRMNRYNKIVKEKGQEMFKVELPDSVVYLTSEELLTSDINIPVQQKFQIAGFGTYNCDILYRIEQPVVFRGNIVAENGAILHPKNVIVIDKKQNGTLNTKWKNSLMFDAASNVAIIAPLKDGKIAYISSSDLKNTDLRMTNKLQMKVIDTNELSFKEIEKLL